MASLSFSAANGQFESDWFQPNNPFQLDLRFSEADDNNVVRIYSSNEIAEASGSGSGSGRGSGSGVSDEPYALACEYPVRGQLHVNIPIFDVIPSAGVYYKVATTRVEPTSASYVTE